MPTDCVTYQKSGYFSSLINDYLDEIPEIRSLYNRFPKIENFAAQIIEKKENFKSNSRLLLVNALQNQYKNFVISEATNNSILSLKSETTFTITTGHQLNLFSGPMYFLYKIISTINLCKILKKEYPENNFVPVYWMATEDHDFEEINHFYFKGKKIIWNENSKGPVGNNATKSLNEVYQIIDNEFGKSQNAQFLKSLFKQSYLENSTLASATRFLANSLFNKDGLVIIDGNDLMLKKSFSPYITKEIEENRSFKAVSKTISEFDNYNVQVNPREINLFYIENQLRERIVFENDYFKVNSTDIKFTSDEINQLIDNESFKFSPNVILRPLYQEVILPNLCYIGGGGEIAYWLELKSMFEAFGVTFPMLLIRNSVVIATQKQLNKADKLGLTWQDLFCKQQVLFDKKTKELSDKNLDFTDYKNTLQSQFESLKQVAKTTDASFIGAVLAQEKKQIDGLEKLEKRLLKAEKRVHKDALERIFSLQNELFPNQGLQERKENFASFYIEYGETLITKLKSELNPLKMEFTIINL
jgi:bacillithiol biosynthesis cysteine-adding enzyme BshC